VDPRRTHRNLRWPGLGRAGCRNAGLRWLIRLSSRHLARDVLAVDELSFIWQTVCTAPFSIASGAVGFSNYARYLWPSMSVVQGKLLAAAVCPVMAYGGTFVR
jgi:hypothetical protein